MLSAPRRLFFTSLLAVVRLLQIGHAAPTDISAAQSALEKDDPVAALETLQPLAAAGQSEAQHLLGFMYDLGLGVRRDPATGLLWQERAAATGHYWASLYLAWKYRTGSGLKAPAPDKASSLEAVLFSKEAPPRIVPTGWLQVSGLQFQPNYSRATRWLKSRVTDDDALSAANLADYSLAGLGVRPDLNDHLRWLEVAGGLGDGLSLERLSLYHENGLAVAQNSDLAREYLRRAASAGLASAQYNLGRQLARGHGVPVDLAAAAGWYRKAATQKHVEATNRLSDLLRKGIPPAGPDFPEALSLSRQAAALGSAEALADVAGMLRKGQGTAKDSAGAFALYKDAAGKGYAYAAYMAGWMLRYDNDTPKDPAEARRWFDLAVQGEDSSAMREIGLLYADGVGVARDEAEAFVWFERAAREGDDSAQNRVGWMLLNGIGIDKDPEEAITWFTLAAKQNEVNAMISLGYCHELGIGTEKNIPLAIGHYRQALALRDRRAALNLANLALQGAGEGQRQLFSEITPLLRAGKPGDETKVHRLRGLVLLHPNNPLRDDAAGLPILEALNSDDPFVVATLVTHYGKTGAWTKMRACLENLPEPRKDVLDYYLGLVYLTGIGGPADPVAGIAALRRGPKEAALALAYCHYRGIGTPKNDNAAFSLIEQAAKFGESRARQAVTKPSPAEALTSLFPSVPAESGRIPVVHDDGQENARPRLITSSPPVYPFLLSLLGITGSAKVEFIVDEQGVPTDLKLLEATLPDFGTAAIATISQWRLSPGKKDGKRVKTRLSQLLEFTLENAPPASL
jgi:TonB family protein